MADIHTQLWKDFQGFMFKQQITLVRALSDSDMATFMKKLLEKDFMLAKKMFLQFSYEAKKKVLGQVSKTTIRDLLCQSLPSVVKFKLLKEGVTVTLNNKELLSFVRAVLKKIPQRKPSIIRLIRTRVNAYANTKEGWKGQDLVADTQAKDESWFLNFFTDLDPKQKLHLFKKVGSNFEIKDRTLLFEPRGAWKNLLDSGILGGNAFVSALRADPISASDSDFQFWRRGRDSNPRDHF